MYDLMTEFLNFLGIALKNVDEKYWNVHSAEDEDFIRERVFCYELYHEMRKLQENDKGGIKYSTFSNIDLYAEPDKRGWAKLKPDEKKNPDFIFHKKANSNNLIVMEVKGNENGDIKKDFDTLTAFLSEKNYLKYKYGIFLLYGKTMTVAKNKIQGIKIEPGYEEKIIVITQENKQAEMKWETLKSVLEEHKNVYSNL